MNHHEPIAAPHLSDLLLIQAIDGELSQTVSASVDAHLEECPDCRRRYQAFQHLTSHIETAVDAPVSHDPADARDRLQREMQAVETRVRISHPRRGLRRLSWGMAIAAALAFGFLMLPQLRHATAPARSPESHAPASFEVDGELFTALPYSNPDLPLGSSHIVEMQVPVSSLADAGIVFEPISTEMASRQDRSVRADVLFGLDGQPLGVHVLSAE